MTEHGESQQEGPDYGPCQQCYDELDNLQSTIARLEAERDALLAMLAVAVHQVCPTCGALVLTKIPKELQS
jgi:hypothetical protein